MCGIVAVLAFGPSGLFGKDVEIFEQLHKAIALRGEDGAGVFYVGDKKSGLEKLADDAQFSSYVKCSTNPYDLHVSKELLANLPLIEKSRFLVGHVRYATSGNVVTQHAHPFASQNKDILLVHNGNITSAEGVKNVKKFPVDSMALVESLSRVPSVKEALSNTYGAIATIWYNRKEKTINVYRNYDRPLHFVETFNTVYIASEAGALQWVLNRNHTASACKIEQFEEIFHYKWDHEGHLTKEKVKDIVRYHSYPQGRANMDIWDCESGEYRLPESSIIALPHKPNPDPISEISPKEILPPEKEKSPEKNKLKPINEYLGLKRGDTVIFEITDDLLTDSEKNKYAVTGAFVGTDSSSVINYGLFEDVQIHTTLKHENKNELERQMKTKFFRGIIASLMMNTEDATDIKAYIKDARVLTEEEKNKYWRNNQLMLAYRADFAPEKVIH